MNVDFVVVKATVSIHVPARGTTMYFAEVARFNEVSIHVPARGTTWQKTLEAIRRKGFNPRSRKGNDSRLDVHHVIIDSFNPRSRKGNDITSDFMQIILVCVSIHVPARGTTGSRSSCH